MLSHIQRLFAPPVFENDEDKTRMAKVLNTLLVAMMLFLVLVGSIGIPFVLVRKLYDSIIVLGLFLVLLTAHWLMRRGRVRLASAVLIAGIWIIFTIFLPFTGGMTSIIAVFYIVDTVIAGLLLGVRAALIHAAACSLAGLGMVIFESSGGPVPRIFPVPAAMGWVIMTLGLLLTTTVLNLVLNSLNDALALARRQVEERKQAEEALRESEERYRQLFELESDAIFLIENESGRILEVNNAASALYGYSRDELLTKRNTDLSAEPEDTRQVTQETPVIADQVVTIPLRFHRKKDGAVFPVEITGRFFTWRERPVHIAAIRDITERAQVEETLRESHRRLEETLSELQETQERMMHQERLVAVGQLAAGIAHDFNNILATIVLYTQMSLRANETSPQVRQRLEIIARQTDRATDLVQQILDFSRRAMLKRRVLALDSFMKEVVKLLERTLPESIHISLAVEAGEYPINADLTRIQQAIVNLALNARDAMPNGGELRIALSRTQGQEIQCVDCGPMTGGDWIQVTVTDTGTGIPPDVLPHIFEPFFTTRTPLGHGLGLAQVHGIVKQHEGHLDVQTQVGHGTTFRLYWPALSAGQPLALPEAPLEMAQGRGETILVVEDDDTMRAALIDVLDALDYQVLAAANGMEALVVYEQYADEVSLILSDWVMPSIGGLELVRELAARHAAPKVLMLTGHPLTEEAETSVPVNVVGWIHKPPSIEQLAEAVSRALTEGK
jgi:PAS domain S-box-containing protein